MGCQDELKPQITMKNADKIIDDMNEFQDARGLDQKVFMSLLMTVMMRKAQSDIVPQYMPTYENVNKVHADLSAAIEAFWIYCATGKLPRHH